MRPLFFFSILFGLGGGLAGQDLPKAGGGERLGFEPDLMLTNPAKDGPMEHGAAAPSLDVAKLEASLERAKRNAAAMDRLFKGGAAAKVEVERANIRVLTVSRDLSAAKAAAAHTALDELRTKGGTGAEGSDAAALKAAEEVAAAADAAAQEQAAACQKAQLDEAKLNVWRWQKLLSVGAARRSDVARAQEQLAALEQAQAPRGQ